MEELTVIEVSPTAIVAVSRDGHRFTIPVDAELRAGIAHKPGVSSTGGTSPREIQSLLRSGLSVSEVAERTGEDADHIARFESTFFCWCPWADGLNQDSRSAFFNS